MKNLICILLILFFASLLFQSCGSVEDARSASEIGKAVADKIIRESAFELESVELKPAQNIQILDYSNEFENISEGTYYSISEILCEKDTVLTLGASYSSDLTIYVNNKIVFKGKNDNSPEFREIAYSMFSFQDLFEIELNKGENSILIELNKRTSTPIVYLREVPEKAEDKLTANFELNYLGYQDMADQWLSIGPIKDADKIREDILSGRIIEKYGTEKNSFKWQILKEKKIKKLVIHPTNSYQRESYLEWHYANGTVLFGLYALYDITKDQKYSDFIEEAIGFTISNYELFKDQYETLHDFRGSNHRMFRKTMLDDTGAPAIPYVEYFIRSSDKDVEFLIKDMEDYVVNEQVRLEDGTFCRPEPTKMTVWTDDLFMSVPFLVRYGKLTGDTKYFDDAASQVINFNKYLFDEKVGLYKHGWFQESNEKSIAYWGRANGWIIWATTEALLNIPKYHKDYDKMVEIFRTHIDGIIKYQNVDGMWHQILNKPESFKETSCTAMYIIGIMRGVENDWLPDIYMDNALLAWDELKTKIMENGTVKDICRGTGIGFDLEFYFNRKRFDNDPRGLGAVLTAISEIIKSGY